MGRGQASQRGPRDRSAPPLLPREKRGSFACEQHNTMGDASAATAGRGRHQCAGLFRMASGNWWLHRPHLQLSFNHDHHISNEQQRTRSTRLGCRAYNMWRRDLGQHDSQLNRQCYPAHLCPLVDLRDAISRELRGGSKGDVARGVAPYTKMPWVHPDRRIWAERLASVGSSLAL